MIPCTSDGNFKLPFPLIIKQMAFIVVSSSRRSIPTGLLGFVPVGRFPWVVIKVSSFIPLSILALTINCGFPNVNYVRACVVHL